ncbi:hypothetical protein Aab01nite_47580 [Paractinoplanes abujensis]|uniref:DUF6879 domain-containing protein n=1 Tax=Paractinoplanes abujensis TaxID=882441 RepID=A0A7W7CKT7_9ACTN|nr:DUF6879 family protein [Actinoplanes abujensis]MBB4690404.1 hypothetical protein [Actinoplanes abujensis]GID21168.1 hypothetical protein Aab01nite_47580 [Actinoplanes abujensis]
MSVPARQVNESSGVIRTAVLTVATGGTTFLVTNGLDQPQATCIILSILIGGIVLITRFLIAFEKRLAEVEKLGAAGMADMKRLVGDAFFKISEATDLFGSVEASALQTDVVTQLVRNSTLISPDSPPIVHRFVEAKIKETSDFLKQLSDGSTVTYYGEDRDWLLGLTRHATASIDAISLASVDHDLWNSEIGLRYLDAQRRAARNGMRVRRIFVLERPDPELGAKLLGAYEEQRQMAIDVRLLVRSAVPTPLQIQLRDLVVFDDIVAYETTPTISDPHLAQVAETRLVLTAARVKDCSQMFRELWELSCEPGTGQRNA